MDDLSAWVLDDVEARLDRLAAAVAAGEARTSPQAWCPVCGRGRFDWHAARVRARAVLFAAMSDDPNVPDPDAPVDDDDPDAPADPDGAHVDD